MKEHTQNNSKNAYDQSSTSNDEANLIHNEGEVVMSIPISTSFSKGRRRMHKVPPFLRQKEHSKFHYDPVVVSLGPYHHHKEELQLAENFKPKCFELFASKSGYHTDFYYHMVRDAIHDVRRCYVENSTDEYDDDVFAKMMLHDASFIINFIYMYTSEKKTEVDYAFADHLGELGCKLIFHDIWLLENQIPFWFLNDLIHLRFGEDVGDKMLNKYLSYTLSGGYKMTTERDARAKEPLHLLELFRRLHVADRSKDKEPNYHWPIFKWLGLQSSRIGKACRLHCIDIKLDWLWTREKANEEFDVRKYYHSFRSAMDLKAKGIYLKPSRTHSYKDVKFKSSYFYAQLQLPFEPISIYTKVIVLNMIAFELCPNSNTDLAVSSYIIFFKTLIQSPKDVKELREKRIIYDEMGSDEELLQLYKDIDTYGVDNLNMFYDVRNEIQEHYNSKVKTWLAELFHTYFRTPWSVIALLAAVILLFATLVQSYFTVYPSHDK